MNELIDRSGFKSFDKVKDVLKKSYPEMKDKEIRRVVDERLHDRRVSIITMDISLMKSLTSESIG